MGQRSCLLEQRGSWGGREGSAPGKARALVQEEGAKPNRKYPSSRTHCPACQVSECFRCSLPLPPYTSPFSTLTCGLSTPVHLTGMSLTSETSGCLLGKAGCEPHLRDITGHPSHWEFECCQPQDNRWSAGLRAQSGALRNSVV